MAQVFSCEFCEISENNFFTEYVWTTTSISFCFTCWSVFVTQRKFPDSTDMNLRRQRTLSIISSVILNGALHKE